MIAIIPFVELEHKVLEQLQTTFGRGFDFASLK